MYFYGNTLWRHLLYLTQYNCFISRFKTCFSS
uniref:Uncharacterized protein n=1 Tax=Anguilla anguilla TaxID=7936 RepID=A0A0E9QV59_ANGAN